MSRLVFTGFFLALHVFRTWSVQGQSADTLSMADSERMFASWLPPHRHVTDTAGSDFNQDGKRDYVLILESDAADSADQINRGILILSAEANTYHVSAYCREAIRCEGCGGVFGDPFAGFSLTGNVLHWSHYGGSAWRWGEEITFRYQCGEWQLIGFSKESYSMNAGCEQDGAGAYQLTDVNYTTRMAHCIRTKEDACHPYQDVWKKFLRQESVLLQDFNINRADDDGYIPKDLKN